MWVKIPIMEAGQIKTIAQEFLQIAGLKVKVDVEDIREYLIYHILGEFAYIYMGLFDLDNKNRLLPSSEEENGKWDAWLSGRWEVVNDLPSEM